MKKDNRTQASNRAERRRTCVALLLLPLFVSACSVQVREPSASAPISESRALASWSQVLQRFVDEQGRVDFKALAAQPAELDTFVGWIAVVSPHNHPERFAGANAKLAYHINAYNALSMYNVLQAGSPRSLSGFAKVDFFALRELKIGGRWISLYDYENDVIRPLGDARVHFALNCMAVSCPRLPRVAFDAATLDEVLDEQARRFFAESRNLEVDVAAQTVTFSEILDFFADDFLAHAASLPAYARRYHEGAVPEAYAVRFRDYDWTVNHQP